MPARTHWGWFAPLDAARRPLAWPEELLYVGPHGLGDTLVALPTLRRIRRAAPHTRVTWMARAELEPVVRMMGVDAFQDRDERSRLDVRRFGAIVASADFDAAFFGGIERVEQVPVRIGPSGSRERPRVWNHLVKATRFGYPRHEAQRYLRRLLPFGCGQAASAEELARDCRLQAPATALPPDVPTRAHVVLHPFSMGHGREWPLAHWIELANLLAQAGVPVVFTGSAAEGERLARAWPQAARPAGVIDTCGRLDLLQLCALLQAARAMAASGTGPLHLAAALGTPTLGLYPPRKGVAVGRWAALGPAAVSVQLQSRCVRAECQNDACQCMAALAPQRVASALQPAPGRAPDVEALSPYLLAAPCNEAALTAIETTPTGDQRCPNRSAAIRSPT
ncbi:MAG: glycosyltransferase family 9 protein [Burkholderiaceae bacterium]|nr:glycosyltransferase family 9 protein [Burkholderiaceae bacterium]